MKYNINKENLSKILLNIENEIKQSENTLKELLEIDRQYSNMKIDISMFQHIFDKLKNEKLDIQNAQKVMIIYNGNPIITLNLCILAILTKTTIILDFESSFLGVNTLLIEITNNTLKNFNTDSIIHIKSKNTELEDLNKIICIDNIYKYNSYKRQENKKVKFYSLNYVDFYRDGNDFYELTELMYQFAEENEIPIESYSEFEAEEAAKSMEMGMGTCVLLLSSSEKTKEIFKKAIRTKKLIINQNPFTKEIELINKKIFYLE